MKILYLIEELNGGGKERRLVELLKGLTKDANFEIHLALTRKGLSYPEVNELPITIHRFYEISDIGLINAYRKLIKKIKPEVVHTWSFKTSFYASLLKPLFKFKFIVGFIGDTFGFSKVNRLLAKLLIFKQADTIVSNSQAGLAAYQVPVKKGQVIYNGFDPARISTSKENKLEMLGITTPLKVVMLANVTPYKDYRLFIDIAEQVISQRDDVTFISIGKILPEFKELVSPYVDSKHPKIKFLGFRNDVADLIKDCDLGLLCTYTEGISNAIIELMANGVPVITNDTKGGSKEIICSNINGVICEGGEILECLKNLIDSSVDRSRLSNSAKQNVLNRFTLEAMVFKYKEVYKS